MKARKTNMNKEEKWNNLLEMGVSEQTLQICTDVAGYSDETLDDILYSYAGYRDFDRLDD